MQRQKGTDMKGHMDTDTQEWMDKPHMCTDMCLNTWGFSPDP